MSNLIEDLKRRAKRIQRATGAKHSDILNGLAKDHDHHHWAALIHVESKKTKEAANGRV